MKFFLRGLLGLVCLLVMFAVTAYLYLAPDKRPEAVVDPQTQVRLDSGEIVGYRNQHNTFVWQGIPYATPPLGELRWRAPRPVKPWEGVKEALAFGDDCAAQTGQTAADNNHFVGGEDCLYLNVYAPPNADNLPVMFWIHGGANNGGASSQAVYDGSRLASQFDVVVVSLSYRLTNLGWLSHPALRLGAEVPQDHAANFGTLDQLAGLRWVQRNIRAFGGNPDKVTIFGESAGGWNVMALLASPLATGLFHGAIAQSGGLDIVAVESAQAYVDDGGHQHSSREFISQLLVADGKANDLVDAKAVQNAMSDEQLAVYLRGKSLAELFGAFRSESGGKVFRNLSLIGDGIVLPDAVPSQELFADPANYNSVPVMLGTNLDEMRLFMAFNPEQVHQVAGLPVGIKDLQRYELYSRYGSDQWKIIAVDRLATVMREAQGDSVYAYRFDANDLRNFGFLDLKDLFGAAHAFELPYIFGNFDSTFMKVLHPVSSQAARDALSNSMMSYWAAMAHHGKPGKGYLGNQVEWGAWENGEGQPRLMVLDSKLGEGIRMSTELLTMDHLKASLFQESALKDQAELCAAYKMLFRKADFVQEEYDSLGGVGCAAVES